MYFCWKTRQKCCLNQDFDWIFEWSLGQCICAERWCLVFFPVKHKHACRLLQVCVCVCVREMSRCCWCECGSSGASVRSPAAPLFSVTPRVFLLHHVLSFSALLLHTFCCFALFSRGFDVGWTLLGFYCWWIRFGCVIITLMIIKQAILEMN